MPNKSDAPMQSRMVVIEFEPLEDSDTPDVERWGELVLAELLRHRAHLQDVCARAAGG